MFNELDVQEKLENVLAETSCFSSRAIDQIAEAVYLDVYDNVVDDKNLDPDEDFLEDLDDGLFRDCYYIPVTEYIDSHLVKD